MMKNTRFDHEKKETIIDLWEQWMFYAHKIVDEKRIKEVKEGDVLLSYKPKKEQKIYYLKDWEVDKMEIRHKVDPQEIRRGNYAIKNMTASIKGIPSDENKKKIVYEFNQKAKVRDSK